MLALKEENMTTKKTYEQVLIGLGTVLLLVKEMHRDLISQIEALPLGESQAQMIQELKEHTNRITREDIMDRIRQLYPQAEILQEEKKAKRPEPMVNETKEQDGLSVGLILGVASTVLIGIYLMLAKHREPAFAFFRQRLHRDRTARFDDILIHSRHLDPALL